MPTPTADLFLLEDVEATSEPAEGDLAAFRGLPWRGRTE